MQFISLIFQWCAPVVIAFMEPKRCQALFKAVCETIEYVEALNNDNPDDDYQAALEFCYAQSDLLESVLGENEMIDNVIKETVIPFILGFVYSKGDE